MQKDTNAPGSILLLIGWGIALFMLAVILYPPDIKKEDSFEKTLEKNRKWLLGTFVVFVALDVAQTAVRGQLFEPKIYLPFVLHFAALAAIGIPIANKRYQVFLAWYFLIALVLWCLADSRTVRAACAPGLATRRAAVWRAC